MVEADKAKFAEWLTKFTVIHRAPAPSHALLRAYWDDLHEMRLDEFERSSKHLVRTSKWFPKPADFWTASKAGWQ